MIGAFIGGVANAVTAAVSFLIREAVLVFKACCLQPRAFIAIGLALAVGHWRGFESGYSQGEGDLATFKQSAEIWAQDAADTKEAALRARKEAARKEADAPEPAPVKCEPASPKPKVIRVPAKCPKPEFIDFITGSVK